MQHDARSTPEAEARSEIELDPHPGPLNGRRGARLVALVAVVLLVVGAVAVLAGQRGAQDPEATLTDITAFVENGTTVHVEGLQEWSSLAGRDGLGSEMSDRSRLVADVRLPRESRLRIDDGDELTEVIILDHATYVRYATDEKALANEPWVKEPPYPAPGGETAGPSAGGGGGAMSDLLVQGIAVGNGLGMSPIADLQALLDAFEEPVRVGGNVIRVKMSLRRLMEILTPDLPPDEQGDDEELGGTVTVDLTSGPGGRLDRMRTTVEMTDGQLRSTSTDDLRFTNWGRPVAIAPPGDDEIDHTPSFDEEALARSPFPLLAPARVPEPLRLLEASYSEGDEELEECASVYLRYADPAAEEAYESAMEAFDPETMGGEPTDLPLVRSLDITLSDVACTFDDKWSGPDEEDGLVEPFTAGAHRGTIVRTTDPEYGPTVHIVVDIGRTRLDISADIPEADVVAALAALAPLDLASQPVVQLAL